ncbi:bile acid:sodium symporter family protein [Dawidia soli]|uniref:Bile acid:sodium symporter family protein n=1 Tax=Dawidia soli TaxID=2782352 RepID=A0AAP2GH98_9BACT|nr:bile acid:sodium symporter family protein [Dawidia soli]MBT1685778.1 bile acid:sodium symporter family protein [Dawidia soli]
MIKAPFAFLKRIGLDGFILALGSVILLAYLWPAPGIMKHPISLATIANYGVTLIFFFYGLKLSPGTLKASLGNWRLHTVVQASTFILFPLVGFAIYFAGGTWGEPLLWLGILYVTVLPSTVSSSVVMVSMAGGNIPAAIFNASISGLLGVIITPVLMSPVLENQVHSFDAGDVIVTLGIQVLAPVFLGILLHPTRIGAWAVRKSASLRIMDQSVILLIVYISFCESFAGRMFGTLHLPALLLLLTGMATLFAVIFMLTGSISRWMGFSDQDRITAVFCGTKKSLVHGTVMSKILFAGIPAAGLVLLPIMVYHAIQLILSSVIAKRMATRTTTKPSGARQPV